MESSAVAAIAETDSAPTVAKPRRRIQFSLLTLLLATLVFSLGTLLFLCYREVTYLRNRNAQLSEELGIVTVADPLKGYIKLRKPAFHYKSGEYTWQIYLPQGRRYSIFVSDVFATADQIAAAPTQCEFINTSEGQFQLEYRPVSVLALEKTFLISAASSTEMQTIACKQYHEYVEKLVGVQASEEFDPDRPLLILSQRSTDKNAIDAGFTVWLKPEKAAN